MALHLEDDHEVLEHIDTAAVIARTSNKDELVESGDVDPEVWSESIRNLLVNNLRPQSGARTAQCRLYSV